MANSLRGVGIADLASLLGRVAVIKMECLRVECMVQDVKSAYGSIRLLVEPVRGSSRQWVDEGRVISIEDPS